MVQNGQQYTAMDIAHYIVDKCTKDNHPISNLQLQKMLYFIQGEFYKLNDTFLFEDEIYAWPYGPVVEDVYDEFCSNGAAPICDLFNVHLPGEIRDDIDPLIEKYRSKSVWDLVDESHKPGGPWDTVYQGYKTVIPKCLIKDYFCKKA